MTTSPPPTVATDPAPTAHPATDPVLGKKPQSRKKKPARRARRRAASGSDTEEEDNDGPSDASSSSATADSSDAESEDEEEDDQDDQPSASARPGSQPVPGASAFPDVSSTTPAAWSNDNEPTEQVSFDAFNRGETGLAIRGAAKRGRGRGRGGAAGSATAGEAREVRERKPLTEEQIKRLEEKRARMKERQKAKRKELKEARRKLREGNDAEVKQDTEAAAKEPEAAEAKEPEASTSEVKPAAEPKEEKKANKKAKAKGKNKETSDPSTLADATSALTLEPSSDHAPSTVPAPSPAPASTEQSSRRPPTGPRQSRDFRSDDPKITPRAGNFWTHDQRYDQNGEGFGGRGSWRGRGFDRGSLRGGFRGRGRGGFAPPFAPGRGGANTGLGRGRELTDGLEQDKEEGEEKTLEMDKLEAALEKQKEAARKEAARQEAAMKEAEVTDVGEEPVAEAEQAPAEVKARPPKESKWGHEGFESMQAVMHFQANRMLRGRGRGRGFFGAARGGFVPRQPFHGLPTPNKTPETAGARLPAATNAPNRPSPLNAPAPAPVPVASTEETSTAPTSESLLDSDAVTVKLPGSEAVSMPLAEKASPAVQYSSISRPSSSTQPSASSTSIRASAPVFVQPKPVPLHATPAVYSDGTASPQPFPANGSENGSISSNGHYAGQASYLPPGVGVTPAGEYYQLANGASADLRPAMMPPQQRPQQFYPQQQRAYPSQPQVGGQPFYPASYSPDLFHHHPSRHPSFGSAGYMDVRAGSPFHYPSQPAVGANGSGLFVPPRSGKVSIKAPLGGDAAGADGEEGLKRYASIDPPAGMVPAGGGGPGVDGGAGMMGQAYYTGHYNPYAVAAGTMGYETAWAAGGEGYGNEPAWGYGY